jgi:hypothetical protein
MRAFNSTGKAEEKAAPGLDYERAHRGQEFGQLLMDNALAMTSKPVTRNRMRITVRCGRIQVPGPWQTVWASGSVDGMKFTISGILEGRTVKVENFAISDSGHLHECGTLDEVPVGYLERIRCLVATAEEFALFGVF